MIKSLVLMDGGITKVFDVEVRLRDGFVLFKYHKMFLEGVFADYCMLRYRFTKMMMDRYCGVNVFFTRSCLTIKKSS